MDSLTACLIWCRQPKKNHLVMTIVTRWQFELCVNMCLFVCTCVYMYPHIREPVKS